MLHLWNYRASKGQEGLAARDEIVFSMARYEPMARLLSDEDLLFLKAQSGFRPAIARKFTRERRRIFRLYLEELSRDFHRLHAQARAVVASLPAEHSSLVGVLLRGQFRFWYEMAAIELSLSLSWAGIGSLDVSNLLTVLGGMQIEINRLSAPAVA